MYIAHGYVERIEKGVINIYRVILELFVCILGFMSCNFQVVFLNGE